jgi:hypothetical protein
MLTFWNSKFYVLCNACPVHEERGLTEILLMQSDDGMNWGKAEVVFPHVIYKGEPTFCNHRMGFYITPSGRLLATTAYFPQSEMPPQSGSEDTGKKYFGITVREIKPDGTFGEIYFVARNNSLYSEDDFPFPYYTESDDADFIEGCETLRNDKLLTLHWWEQMRPENFDFPESLVNQIKNGNRKFAKAISYYTRPDSAVVAFWKSSKSALSFDEGNSWSDVTNLKTFSGGYAKVWGQSTEDGRYAASWQPRGEGSWGRYPMLWATSDDGVIFDGAMHVNGEVTMRYEGGSKNIGPCNYQRGIYEGGPDIPGDDVWVVYSMSKEDIWISKIPVPFSSSSDEYVNQDFNSEKTQSGIDGWNIYHPKWAPVYVDEFPSTTNKSLRFADKDPFDYAKAFKVFKETKGQLLISFKILARQNNHGRFEIEIGDTKNLDPIKLIYSPEGKIQVAHWAAITDLSGYRAGDWMDVQIDIDVDKNRFVVSVDGKQSDEFVFNSRKIKSLDRITFRTGINRGISINPVNPEEDLPLQNEAVFFVDDVIVKGLE